MICICCTLIKSTLPQSIKSLNEDTDEDANEDVYLQFSLCLFFRFNSMFIEQAVSRTAGPKPRFLCTQFGVLHAGFKISVQHFRFSVFESNFACLGVFITEKRIIWRICHI